MRADGHTLAAQEWVVTEGWDAGRGRWCCLELRPATSGEIVDETEREKVVRQPIYVMGDPSDPRYVSGHGVLAETAETHRSRSRQRKVGGTEAMQILRRMTGG